MLKINMSGKYEPRESENNNVIPHKIEQKEKKNQQGQRKILYATKINNKSKSYKSHECICTQEYSI